MWQLPSTHGTRCFRRGGHPRSARGRRRKRAVRGALGEAGPRRGAEGEAAHARRGQQARRAHPHAGASRCRARAGPSSRATGEGRSRESRRAGQIAEGQVKPAVLHGTSRRSLMNARRIILASIVLLVACGNSLPPRELVDARSVFEKAKTGQASQLKPEMVHEAKVALDQAEQAFVDDSGGDRTRDLSYIAQRKSELAMAQAGQSAAIAQKEQASRDLVSLQAQGLQKAQGELSQ